MWRNVTKNGQIKKCILVDGIMEGGRPKPGDAVLVKTQGKLKDGTIIDDEPSLVFNVGDYEVILTLFAYYNSKRAPLLPCEFKDMC